MSNIISESFNMRPNTGWCLEKVSQPTYSWKIQVLRFCVGLDKYNSKEILELKVGSINSEKSVKIYR